METDNDTVRTYASKLGPGLVIPLALLLGGMTLFFLYARQWPAFIFLLALDFFIIHLFATTYYQLNSHTLRVKCGFLFDKSIPVHAIRKISETQVALSAPATSFDRLEILYNSFDTVIISPKDKAGFIDHIRAINPFIEVDEKRK